jgi:triacylglycerol lipase
VGAEPAAVVFVHGLLGFSEIHLPFAPITMFRGVAEDQAGSGRALYFPTLPPVASVAERGTVLAAFLAKVPEPRIHLIAHSMGGLDSRYLIHYLDPERRVRSLTTIASPHHGSPIADWTLDTAGPFQWTIRPFLHKSLEDLRVGCCAQFNIEVPDRPDCAYFSYGAARPVAELPFYLHPFGRRLLALEGSNDGQVSVDSARWGTYQGTLRADHFEVIGWSTVPADRTSERPFDHFALFRRILTGLLA